MSDETCGAELEPGVYCQRPPHTDPLHSVAIDLPADINMVLAELMNQAETAIAYHRKWGRRSRIWVYVCAAAGAINVAAAVYSMLRLWN